MHDASALPPGILAWSQHQPLALSLAALPAMTDRVAASARAQGRIAIQPLTGVLRPPAMASFRAALRQAVSDRDVKGIVLDIDSPGGTVEGTAETAAAVAEASTKKPVIAVANSLACSAACWIAAHAGEFVLAPHAITGSIGVIAMHADMSALYKDKMGINMTLVRSGARKAEGDPYGPLSDQARLHLEAMVATAARDFIAAIASARKMSPAMASERFADGRALLADEAIALGLADRVATLDSAVAALAQNKTKTVARRPAFIFS